ncbi:hypothetical protein IWQ60_012432 [Tieghemiomyces parasiticus]|uniref:Glyoxylate reductase n=1 Tax=Tieghemiomyces parasiticus TaxID=78921 RepID=A0A9W7ZQ52_9FUNG|nr:hypothetical protein IWQ60_012432 [Tieghemiomyces parasiticus]
MAPKKVFSSYFLTEDAQKRLESLGYDLDQSSADQLPRTEFLRRVKGVHGIICDSACQVDAETLDAAGDTLQVISTHSVGYNHVDLAEAHRRGIQTGHTPDVLTDAVADLALTLILMVLRRVVEAAAVIPTGQWCNQPTWMLGRQLRGKAVGIVGLGRIGEGVAQRLRGFGVSRILYSGRRPREEAALRVGANFVSFDELVRQSDVVCICCSLNDSTYHLFTYDVFKLMKPTAVIINISRGGVIKQEDLVSALANKIIGGAGLDVMTPEPLPTDSHLLKYPNCVLLPHIGSATVEAHEAMGHLCIDNLQAGLEGKPLPHPIPQ